MTSDIDIIIPVYNCEKFIDEAIFSIESQSYKSNIYILDDCSTDNSFNKLSKKAATYINRNAYNVGNLATVNTLLSKTQSNFIAFQDADDWSDKYRLQQQIDFLEKNNLDFCFTNYVKTTSTREEIFCGYYSDTDVNLNNIQEFDYCFASILFKRKIYETIGGFDNYFDRIGAADNDWLYRMVLSGYKGAVLNKPLYFYRNNETSYTSTVSLDPRKHISTAIAKYFFYHRRQTKNIHNYPIQKDLDKFIEEQLSIAGYNSKKNLKEFIVQQVAKKKYVLGLKKYFLFLKMAPRSIQDLKLLKYIVYKILNND